MSRVHTYTLPDIFVTRLLVTGGRKFMHVPYLRQVLDSAQARYGFRLLIHGGARGVDLMADQWARERGVQPVRCDALWSYHIGQGNLKGAGLIRNREMLLLNPHLTLAFPGERGTADMRNRVQEVGIPLVDLTEDFELEMAP